MKINIKQNKSNLILGSTFLGTGGGGKPDVADKLYSLIKNVDIKKLKSMKETDIFITVFGVGPSSLPGSPEKFILQGFNELQKYIAKPISGIIPVEIGPGSLATACYLASLLKLPLIDADFVGGRSAPEIYLETITMFGLSRTPLVVVSENNNFLVIKNEISYLKIEEQIRKFSTKEKTKVYVVGYPLTKKQLLGKIELGTVTEAISIGKVITTKGVNQIPKTKVIFRGTVSKVTQKVKNGFTFKNIQILSKGQKARIFVKNEYLGLWIKRKLILSCPDLIIITNTKKPLYNTEIDVGMKISVLSYKAKNLWRTKKGIKLFNPKVFGFAKKEKLLD